MRIIRQVFPQGHPIIVDAQLDDDNGVVQDSVVIYPILPNGIIGQPIFSKEDPATSILDEIINDLLNEN